MKWDLLPRNYAEDAEPPRAPRPRITVWTPEELGAFIRHVRGDRFFALWLLVATTGLRRGELAGLARSDIDLKAGRVHPSTPRVVVAGRTVESEAKTRSGVRSLALDPDTNQALDDYLVAWDEERYLLGQPRQLLFVWPNGNPLHPGATTALFHKHCEAAGLPRIRRHDVRHSYATAALKAGISPKVISERLGHSSAAFTLHTYTHVIPGMDEMAADTGATLIRAAPVMESDPECTMFGTRAEAENPERQSAPGIPGADVGSGGSVLFQDIGNACLKT